MGFFPLAAAVVAGIFTVALARQYAQRKRPYQLMWAIAMALYALASLALFWGVAFGWMDTTFRVYWLCGAVLTVPFLAGGEVCLLFRGRIVRAVTAVALVVLSVVAVAIVFSASMDWHPGVASGGTAVLTRVTVSGRHVALPSGADVFELSTLALTIARLYAYPTYLFLLFGTLWSAWKMRGAPELRNRFYGTLLIALGATIVAGGSAFAATGILIGFSITLLAGISVMFLGFLKASAPGKGAPTEPPGSESPT
jgi:hypothetical protein